MVATGIRLNHLTELIIGAAIEVHRVTGPGLIESVYEGCLCYELTQRGLSFQRQIELPVCYKGINLDCALRIDLLVEESVVLELKSVDRLLPVHSAQLLTYLKLTGKKVGLLINFNERVLTSGLKRVVNHFPEPETTPVTSAPSVTKKMSSNLRPKLGAIKVTSAPSAFSDLFFAFLTALRLSASAVKKGDSNFPPRPENLLHLNVCAVKI